MKKQLTIMIAAVLTAGALAIPASADETEITTTIDPSYTVTIPANLTVPFNQEVTDFGAVELGSPARLEPNKRIQVTMTCSGSLKNQADTKKVLPYTILTKGEEPAAFTEAVLVKAGDKQALTVNIAADDWNKAYAGTYKDTVTFNIACVDAT
jgi:spore coat protein U-like protein